MWFHIIVKAVQIGKSQDDNEYVVQSPFVNSTNAPVIDCLPLMHFERYLHKHISIDLASVCSMPVSYQYPRRIQSYSEVEI